MSTTVDAASFDALHELKIRGFARSLGTRQRDLLEHDLVVETPVGFMLTETGDEVHSTHLRDERSRLDLAELEAIYERFLVLNREFKLLCSRWHTADAGVRADLAFEADDIMDRVRPILRRTAKTLPRFDRHLVNLATARDRFEHGYQEWLLRPDIDSIHTVWMHVHEDFIQTLGRNREDEEGAG